MDFNLNDEQELFVAGIRELMASENWEAYFAECDRDSVYPERFVKALADMGIAREVQRQGLLGSGT